MLSRAWQSRCSLFCVTVSHLLLAFLDPFLFSREIYSQNQQTTRHGITSQQGFTAAVTNMSCMWAAQQTAPWLCLWMPKFIPETKVPFWSHHLCQFSWEASACSLWERHLDVEVTFPIRITALLSFFQSMTSTKLHFGLLSAENTKSRNIYF